MTDAEIVKELMRIMPHGYTPSHLPENLPDRLSWFVSETVRQDQVIEKLEALLTHHGIPLPE